VASGTGRRLDHQEAGNVLGFGPVVESRLDAALVCGEGSEVRKKLLGLVALYLTMLDGLTIEVWE